MRFARGVVILAALLALASTTVTLGQPTLEEQIEEAVILGLDWLAGQQAGDGSWPYGCESVAATGLAVLKFEDRALDLGLDPLDPAYEYHMVVEQGLLYIQGYAWDQAIGPQPAGDPDGNGNGKGVFFTACPGGHDIYNTGIAMMALAGSRHPELYGDLLQDAVDYMAWAQADDYCGVHRGGWRYQPDCNSDNSNSGYVTLGLGFAQAAPPYGFGLTVPQWVEEELSVWVDLMQDDVDGDLDDGGSWYDPFNPWVNILKTGNLIYEMGLVGDDLATPRVQDAIDYVERHWNDPGFCDTGWADHRQAMFTMMKGLEAMGVDTLTVGGMEIDWFAEVATHLIATQNADGSWPTDCWAGQILSTAWALLTLEKAVPTFEVTVAVDIKPTSCPNPFNVDRKGVTPVAILGTADFDVTQVDPATVLLAGVAPLRWALEDVATPFEPFIGKEDLMDCNELGADGYLDLTFKFDAQELTLALGDVDDGDVLVLPLTGNLLPELGGTPIVGEDVIRVLEK